MTTDTYERFKATQRERWGHFAPLAAMTTMPAARLVRFAGISRGDRVLDAACGTGVVAVTAARLGAHVTALDLTPDLLAVARDNAVTASVEIDFHEGDCEQLPLADASFDVLTSQYGHIFAPRPELAVREMLRVLKPGGTIAFSTWPPELFVGRVFALVARYLPPPPIVVPSPTLWGDPNIIRERLGAAVTHLQFERDTMLVPTLSPRHSRMVSERTSGQVIGLVESLSASDPQKLEAFRREYEALAAEYFVDNTLRQGYLMTRATKV